MNLNAFHVYYLREPSTDKWEFINTLVQYSSIVHWKKFYGPIHLYCNTHFYEEVKKNKLEHLYDSINVDLLDQLPDDKLNKFWSFAKLVAIKNISENYKKFVVLDTDLWIQSKLDFSGDFLGYHLENICDHPRNPYIDPRNYVDTNIYNFNWSVRPVNCAFLYFNSKVLIDTWIDLAEKIVNQSDSIKINDLSSDTIFIEQRLISVLADYLKLSWGTLIKNVYYPEIQANDQGDEWIPPLGNDEESSYFAYNIKHVWGLKKRYQEIEIRDLVLSITISSLQQNFHDWQVKIPELVDKIVYFQRQGELCI